MYKESNFSELIGKNLIDVKVNEDEQDVTFICENKIKYSMFHYQQCCESVYIAEIIGDLSDLINTPIIDVQILTNENNTIDKNVIRELEDKERPRLNKDAEIAIEDASWTFYKITTNKGDVVFRWCGLTGGCYSLEVGFYEIVDNEVYN